MFDNRAFARKHLFLKICFYLNPEGWLIFNRFMLFMNQILFAIFISYVNKFEFPFLIFPLFYFKIFN